MIYGFLLALALPAAATEAPFSLQAVENQTDVGAINQNFRNTSDAIRKADLTSGGTVSGNLIVNAICFGNSTDCQTTVPTESASAVYYSSFSKINRGNATNTVLGVCRATVTFTTHGCSVLVMATATLKGVGGARITAASVLVDGAFPSGLTNTMGISMCGSLGEDVHCPFFPPYEITGLSAASHTFCFTPAVNTSSVGVCATDTFSDICKFGVVEVCE